MAININGVDLPAPTRFKIRRFDIESGDSSRNELGYKQRDRIRQGIYEIELEFVGNSSAIYAIESAIEPPEINVTFPSPVGQITKKMYAEDREGPVLINYDKEIDKIYWRISFNLVEY